MQPWNYSNLGISILLKEIANAKNISSDKEGFEEKQFSWGLIAMVVVN